MVSCNFSPKPIHFPNGTRKIRRPRWDFQAAEDGLALTLQLAFQYRREQIQPVQPLRCAVISQPKIVLWEKYGSFIFFM